MHVLLTQAIAMVDVSMNSDCAALFSGDLASPDVSAADLREIHFNSALLDWTVRQQLHALLRGLLVLRGECHPGTALSVLAEPIEAACETANRLGLWFSGLAYETEIEAYKNSTTFDPHHYQPSPICVGDKLLRNIHASGGFKVHPAHRFYWTHVADTMHRGACKRGSQGEADAQRQEFLSAVLPTAARTQEIYSSIDNFRQHFASAGDVS